MEKGFFKLIKQIQQLVLSCFPALLLTALLSFTSIAQTTLDNFADGNYTSNPVWTLNSGAASAATGALVFGSGSTELSLSTPLSPTNQAWSYQLTSSSNFNDDNVRFYFVLVNSSNPSDGSADGYCVDYDGNSGDFTLYRLDNGSLTSLATSNESASTATRTITITMDASGNITVAVTVLGTIISVTNNTYPASTSQYVAITCNAQESSGDTFTIDNITYTPACFNPSSAGTVTNAQSSCSTFDPTVIGSSAGASGQTGTLEYKWQQSTTSSVAGFTDIAGTNSATYDPGTISQTTWYRRLARVTCMPDWSSAQISNVIEMTISCIDPNAGGTISGNQSVCGSFDPTLIASISLPTGTVCPLEYKWQQSTTSSSNGFSDIAGTNTSTYDPGTITQTTWYRRLSKATCSADWTGAVVSNVIEKTVVSPAVITGFPLTDTVYNQSGNASFGVSTSFTIGLTYQWQVSTNGGSSWSNLSNGGLYSGVNTPILQITNPTYGMNGYLYRCVISNSCSTVNTSDATLVVIPQSIFSSSTSASCGSWGSSSTASQCLDVQIPVTGIGMLDDLSNVLKQINVKLGSPSCKRDLSTYDFSLIAPDGTVYNFITNLTTSTTPMWIDIKFRDHSSLERVRDYDITVQQDYFPYSIGYYAVDADNSFIPVFNGKNADGTWIFRVCEQDNDASNISVQSVQLIFGRKTQINDVTSSDANNFCSGAVCVGADGTIIVGTNNDYSNNDPLYPGNSPTAMHPDGSTFTCEYNGANNNSAWFYFIASSTTAYFTVSGITNTTPGNIDTQPIVFSMSGNCSGSYTIPPGGCPDDDDDFGDHYYVNNMEYADYTTAGGVFQNGGGVESDGNIYANGIAANSEFTLSNLTVGQRYYLYIDGNGGISSTFYIEGQFGCETCTTPLPVELSIFDAQLDQDVVLLNWITDSEKNSDRFIVERSIDGAVWTAIDEVYAQVESVEMMRYSSVDLHPAPGVNYYRLKVLDRDGEFEYSDTRSVYNTADLTVLPNPSTGIFGIGGMPKHQENRIMVLDITGKVLEQHSTEEESYQLDLTQRSAGVYLVIINGTESIRVIKE